VKARGVRNWLGKAHLDGPGSPVFLKQPYSVNNCCLAPDILQCTNRYKIQAIVIWQL